MGVMLLDKIKVHELAKKLKVNSKDVIDNASKLGIVLKSHLSTITKEEAEKIAKSMGKTDKEKNEVKKEIVSDKPVIMRRTVIINIVVNMLTQVEIVEAIAAPFMPNLGNPAFPKMRK